MKTEQKSTIRQRVQSRMKGLTALLLAMLLLASMGLAVADEPDNYYLIMGVSSYDSLLCHGVESVVGQKAHDFFGYASNNGYVKWGNNSNIVLTDSSPLKEDGPIRYKNCSGAGIKVTAATMFYFGATSAGKIEVKLNGESKGYNSGTGSSSRKSFTIPAGEYIVQHTGNGTDPTRWIVEINSIITSISLSETSLTFTVGDAAQTLTVDPAAADVEWSSNNKYVATVENGKVTPTGVGATTIIARLKTDSSVTATCEVTVNKLPAPTITDAQKPTGKSNLKATGSAQTLINAPTVALPSGYTMNYALGNNATTAPASGWSAFIPMGNDPGVYYVWYMAKGDETHADTVPAGPIKVTISGEVTPTTEPTTAPTSAPTSAPDNSGSNHSAPTAAPTHVPRTGDTVNLALLIGMLVLGLLGVSVILIRTVRKRG